MKDKYIDLKRTISSKIDTMIFELYSEDEFLDFVINRSVDFKIDINFKDNDTVVDIEIKRREE